MITGTEKIINPLQKSALNKKSLCDYVVNIASGCLHGCTFCYVPSTPSIRTQQRKLRQKGVEDPQFDWGKYLFIREEVPEKLDQILTRKRKWEKRGRPCTTFQCLQNSRARNRGWRLLA
jgi:DNA repair photolyase